MAPAFLDVSANDPFVVRARSTNKAMAEYSMKRLDRLRIRRGEGKRSKGVFPFCCDPQRRPAGGHDPQPRATLRQPGHLWSGQHDLLEVVEKQECPLVTNKGDDPLAERSALCLLHVQRIRERGEEVRRLGDVSHRDERDTVQELRCEQAAELGEDARLPDPARTGDRDDPSALD